MVSPSRLNFKSESSDKLETSSRGSAFVGWWHTFSQQTAANMLTKSSRSSALSKQNKGRTTLGGDDQEACMEPWCGYPNARFEIVGCQESSLIPARDQNHHAHRSEFALRFKSSLARKSMPFKVKGYGCYRPTACYTNSPPLKDRRCVPNVKSLIPVVASTLGSNASLDTATATTTYTESLPESSKMMSQVQGRDRSTLEASNEKPLGMWINVTKRPPSPTLDAVFVKLVL